MRSDAFLCLQHDIVPRFSIKNVFLMKEEMDATKWGDLLAANVKDWMVPDVIENTKAFQEWKAKTKEAAHKASEKVHSSGWFTAAKQKMSGAIVRATGAKKPSDRDVEGAQQVADAMQTVQENVQNMKKVCGYVVLKDHLASDNCREQVHHPL